MFKVLSVLLLTTSCVASGGPPTRALVRDTGGTQDDERGADGQGGHGEHEGHGKGTRTVGGFVGGSGEVGDLEGVTLGLEYEYRLSERWGLGAFAEAITGMDRSFATGVQVSWHAFHEVVLLAGSGVERHHDEWNAIARVGAAYELPLDGRWALAPGVYYDFVEGEDVMIYGVSLVYAW